MSNSGWVVAAALAGFLFGAVVVIQASVDSDARAIEQGLFSHKGHVYRLVEIKP